MIPDLTQAYTVVIDMFAKWLWLTIDPLTFCIDFNSALGQYEHFKPLCKF